MEFAHIFGLSKLCIKAAECNYKVKYSYNQKTNPSHLFYWKKQVTVKIAFIIIS
jgi:hypothetical protein